MKFCLNLFFLFCFTIFSAQHKESDFSSQKKTDTVNIDHKNIPSYSSDSLLLGSQSDHLISKIKIKSPDHKEVVSETKSATELPIADQTINIVQEINAVLNYKLNRVWKRDLYCLVCENYNSGRIA